MIKSIFVYDLEVFPNFFSLSAINISTNEEIVMFLRDVNYGTPIDDIYSWLENNVSGLIGYNNLNYDYPVLHRILENKQKLRLMEPQYITDQIYIWGQEIINEDYSKIPDYKVKIPQLDLYAIHHFDNAAKRTSLKDLEIAMRWEKVQDLPHKFDHFIRVNEVADVLKYNMNDVLATFEFYKKSSGEINLRKQLTKEYKINLTNANDPEIGSEIFAKLLSEKLNIPIKDLRKLRTYRKSIKISDLILPNIRFSTNKFKSLLGNIYNKVIIETKGALKNTLVNKGFKYEFGLGGIHGCAIPGVYIPNKNEKICSCDVASLYPSIAINNGYYPAHLTNKFVEVYKSIRDQRLTAKKAGDKVKDAGLKLAINGVYGKSNSEYSFLYDPRFTMAITVNGQLLLAMLCEALQEREIKLLMVNTDGIECIVNDDQYDDYISICNNWQTVTKLELEQANYDKLIIRDVNNYIGICGNKIKRKGTFEIDKGWHKNTGSRVVSLAVSEYYINGIDPKSFIYSHEDIYDFCNRFKATAGWYSEIRSLDVNKVMISRLQKTNRYYMTKKGFRYYKVHEDGRQQLIEATGEVAIFNNYISKPIKEYNIDYNYYIREVNKILRVVDNNQTNLF